MANTARLHLIICSFTEFVFKLLIPELNTQGKINITAKKDLKKIIWDKWKSTDKNFTKVFKSAKFNDAESIQRADFKLEDINKFL